MDACEYSPDAEDELEKKPGTMCCAVPFGGDASSIADAGGGGGGDDGGCSSELPIAASLSFMACARNSGEAGG
jgi:hypothetical protein